MDRASTNYYIHDSQPIFPQIPRLPQQSTIFGSPSHSSDTSFPIIVVAIIGIFATAFLLVSYYIFVIKCCLSWHRIDLLGRFSFSRNRQREDPLMFYSPATESRGLDESVIRSIPIFPFKKGAEKGFCECAVCLNEFQEEEKLKIIPNCSHVFHIDCIDVWLQNNANCPLCRTSISMTSRFPINHIIAPSSSPQDPIPYGDNFTGRDEDFVVIELQEENPADQSLLRRQDGLNSGELLISPSPRKLEQRNVQKKAWKKLHHVASMGDECIDIREKDDQFFIQPIRRSFSMDSSNDRQLYLSIQAIVQQNRQVNEASPIEGCSSRVKRSFFSFGHGRGSRSAVLPIHLEP
ncbi:hypothetical protein L1049_016417 [Liquidambar formosana]|uniref:RING-type E3 ubiquitin transferase n=1 Tax=Liquidambar formosana TaxID=63359 RepID=A0AAP0S650_LIQFO